MAARPFDPMAPVRSAARSRPSSGRAMVGEARVHGEPGRAIRIDLPSRVELYSMEWLAESRIDQIVTDLSGCAAAGFGGNLSFRIRRPGPPEWKFRRRLPRRFPDHRRVPLTINSNSDESPFRFGNHAPEATRNRVRLMRAVTDERTSRSYQPRFLCIGTSGEIPMTKLLRTTSWLRRSQQRTLIADAGRRCAGWRKQRPATARAKIVKPLVLTADAQPRLRHDHPEHGSVGGETVSMTQAGASAAVRAASSARERRFRPATTSRARTIRSCRCLPLPAPLTNAQ